MHPLPYRPSPPNGAGTTPLIERAKTALSTSLNRARFASRLDRGEVVYITSRLEDSVMGVLDDLPTAPMTFPPDVASDLPPARPVVRQITPAASPAPSRQPEMQGLWGRGQPHGQTIATTLRELIWLYGEPLDLRRLWTSFRQRNSAEPILKSSQLLQPLIARMRLDFRIAEDLRGDSTEERDFVERTLQGYIRTCLSQSPRHELARLRSQLTSKRGPWVKARLALQRALLHAVVQTAGAGRDGEIAVQRQLQRRAVLDAIAAAFEQVLRDDPQRLREEA